MKFFATTLFLAFLFASCHKVTDALVNKSTPPSGQFNEYTIRKGQQYCDQNGYAPVDLSEMKFTVRFDSSAIYQTSDPENQYDINKLYGFSDNNMDHHQYSARFGWRWSDGALRLFAYVYNEGKVESKELSAINIGEEIHCSIKVQPDKYVFSLNNQLTEMPRKSITQTGKGYQLYPYFGGDELAPHEVDIWIKRES
ncbi:MAG: hypothetical protein ACJ75B_11360 [Flavisolibacter sp.]